jgi:hypothetical protein
MTTECGDVQQFKPPSGQSFQATINDGTPTPRSCAPVEQGQPGAHLACEHIAERVPLHRAHTAIAEPEQCRAGRMPSPKNEAARADARGDASRFVNREYDVIISAIQSSDPSQFTPRTGLGPIPNPDVAIRLKRQRLRQDRERRLRRPNIGRRSFIDSGRRLPVRVIDSYEATCLIERTVCISINK